MAVVMSKSMRLSLLVESDGLWRPAEYKSLSLFNLPAHRCFKWNKFEVLGDRHVVFVNFGKLHFIRGSKSYAKGFLPYCQSEGAIAKCAQCRKVGYQVEPLFRKEQDTTTFIISILPSKLM